MHNVAHFFFLSSRAKMRAAATARDHSRSRVVPFFIHHQSRLQCAPMKYELAVHARVRPSSQTFVKRDYRG